jgi:hypothetical protein
MSESLDKRPITLGWGSVASKNHLDLGERLTYERWLEIGVRLTRVVNSSAWWIGDWTFFGHWEYGKKYEDAIAVTGLEEKTLRNYASVAGSFDLSRRRDKLSFGHHASVASLAAEEADRYLDLAEQNGWSVMQLREAIKAPKAIAPAATPAPIEGAAIPPESPHAGVDVDLEQLHFTVPTARLRRWSAAAAASGLSVDAWACSVMDAAAEAIAAA